MIAFIGQFQGHLPPGRLAGHRGRRRFNRQFDSARCTDKCEIGGFDDSPVAKHQLETFSPSMLNEAPLILLLRTEVNLPEDKFHCQVMALFASRPLFSIA